MNNSEILFLYDAKFANPNGDPDEENRPRMDSERDINLVSDLRLKRYIRDYLLDKGYDIFVRKVEDKSVTAEKRMEEFKNSTEDEILNKLIDVRMFGATMPIKGDNKAYIGPVQFNWGYSLNKVELLEAGITSHFSTNDKVPHGTMGRDFRVKYSLIAFSGVVSGKRAAKTKLTDDDLKLLDEAMRHSIQNQATRSKIGQYPRLYIRVEYIDSETILGDFRDLISLKEKVESIRDIKECSLDITKLVDTLRENREKIKNIYYFVDENLELKINEGVIVLSEALKDFNLIEIR
ncbi:type I-B CRISPR-associated protein Cas7/Csh2 [Caloramator sp. Dgby_cultured_2]|uniref:type I-B CRISPR-associated protein Cas7/Csh2 n=1 Tax=Caloramator sp. Dgby_cultured_2 TaxID=3029174 RepID=UPI00237D4B70|nr:type I-B CRISPR-associated protein Cas7/Csh2 [Caloramator sp. Dgby_cultured_2]WDU82931.1 type I-B CRISPR-associated protein Cas7/Csh2 [Caloramator sp. Dgby_cultured_2]